jgi:hypothetical protein
MRQNFVVEIELLSLKLSYDKLEVGDLRIASSRLVIVLCAIADDSLAVSQLYIPVVVLFLVTDLQQELSFFSKKLNGANSRTRRDMNSHSRDWRCFLRKHSYLPLVR